MSSMRARAPADVLAMGPQTHHIISASAGTGKTYAIEHRVLDLIIRGDARIDQVLVVTFTEKATAELRFRIRRKLEALLAMTSSDAREDEAHWLIDRLAITRLQEALLAFDRAPIFTIHGFCHRVASESGFARGRALHPNQVPAESVFAEAFAELVRTELVLDPSVAPLLAAWFGRGRTAQDLRKHLFECRERGGTLEPTLDEEALLDALERLRSSLTGEPGDLLAKLDVHPATLKAIGKRCASVQPVLEGSQSVASAARAIATLEPIRKDLQWLAEHRDKSTGELTLPMFSELDTVALELDAAVTSAILPRLERFLGHRKAIEGQIDFGDMLAQVASALEGPDGEPLCAELRERYPRGLIDEFQDTSELQWKIFRRIYLSGGEAKLTVVGDPKQAIYGFRGADLHTYEEACEQLRAAGAAELALRTNYRSTPKLIEALTTITASVPGEPFFAVTAADARVQAGRDTRLLDANGEPAAAVVVFDADPAVKLTSDALGRKIVDRFTSEVAALLSDHGALEIESGGQRHPIGPADIMMLTRSRGDSERLAESLLRRGIASSTLHNQDLFATREASELLDLLRAIASPRSTRERSRALASRFFDLPLAAVAMANQQPDEVHAIAMLHTWRKRSERVSLEILLPEIVSESKLSLRELATGIGSATMTNTEPIVELLVADVVRSRCGLAELADRLEARIAHATANERSVETPVRIAADADAVQIMTIHSSKGLEAPVVFVFGGYGRRSIHRDRMHTYHAQLPGGRATRRLRVGRPPPELTDAIESERDAENERLMYVAITRAAARLYAVRIEAGTFSVGGPYAILNRRLTQAADQAADDGHFERRNLREVANNDEVATISDQPIAPATLEEPLLPADIEQIREQRAGVAVTSYSRMKRAGGSESAEKLGNDATGVDGSLGRLGGREVGIMLHWILERVDLAEVSDLESAEEFSSCEQTCHLVDRAIRAFAVDGKYREKVEALIFAGLSTPLELTVAEQTYSIGSFRECTREAREVAFTFPAHGDDGELRGYVTGFLDVVLEADGRLYVVDWKSDALASYGPAALAAHVEANYQNQLELYSLALERMLGLTKTAAADPHSQFGGVIYCFLRGNACYGVRPSEADLARFRQTLDEKDEAWQR